MVIIFVRYWWDHSYISCWYLQFHMLWHLSGNHIFLVYPCYCCPFLKKLSSFLIPTIILWLDSVKSCLHLRWTIFFTYYIIYTSSDWVPFYKWCYTVVSTFFFFALHFKILYSWSTKIRGTRVCISFSPNQ